VDQELSWETDDSLFFEFCGEGPDKGAFEAGEDYTIGADPSLFEAGEPITDVIPSYSSGIRWRGNFPNPFHHETSIRFEVEEPSRITVEIFNSSGSRVVTLARDHFPTGIHSLRWNGRGFNGLKVSPGIYLCRLTPSERPGTQVKIVLLD
jgi:hypothetical protein